MVRTVSLETAKRLEELGFPQDIEVGDYCWSTLGRKQWFTLVTSKMLATDRLKTYRDISFVRRGPKLPRLDQVLEEIERLHYLPAIDSAPVMGWAEEWGVMHSCQVFDPSTDSIVVTIHADDMTEAAGLALAMIYEWLRVPSR